MILYIVNIQYIIHIYMLTYVYLYIYIYIYIWIDIDRYRYKYIYKCIVKLQCCFNATASLNKENLTCENEEHNNHADQLYNKI